MSGSILGIHVLRDLVANVPQRLVQRIFHALLQHLDGRSHGADHAASDDALRQLQVGVTEKLDAFVILDELFSDIVQLEKFNVASVEFLQRESGFFHLFEENVTQPGRDVQQRQEAGRIESAAMAQAGADHVILIRRNRLQQCQHAQRMIEYLVCPAQQACSVAVIAVLD